MFAECDLQITVYLRNTLQRVVAMVPRIPRGFLNRYDAGTMIITRANFRDLLEM